MEQVTKKIKLEDERDKMKLEVQNKGENDDNEPQNRGERDNKEGERDNKDGEIIFLVKEGVQEKRYGVIQKFATKNRFICERELSDR